MFSMWNIIARNCAQTRDRRVKTVDLKHSLFAMKLPLIKALFIHHIRGKYKFTVFCCCVAFVCVCRTSEQYRFEQTRATEIALMSIMSSNWIVFFLSNFITSDDHNAGIPEVWSGLFWTHVAIYPPRVASEAFKCVQWNSLKSMCIQFSYTKH